MSQMTAREGLIERNPFFLLVLPDSLVEGW